MMRAAIGGFLAGSIIAFAAFGAKAQDTPATGGSLKDVPVYYYNWSGVYGGLHAGGVFGNVNSRFVPPFAVGQVDVDFDGPVVGGQLGIQYQFGNNVVLGVEASYTGMGTSEGETLCPDLVHFCHANAKDAIQVVGRVGYAWGNFLPYAKGGYANVSINTGRTLRDLEGFDDSRRHDGFTVGGGLEYAYTDGVIIGVDYSHIEVDTERYSLGIIGAERDVDGSLNIVTARVSFKLGWAAAAPLK